MTLFDDELMRSEITVVPSENVLYWLSNKYELLVHKYVIELVNSVCNDFTNLRITYE